MSTSAAADPAPKPSPINPTAVITLVIRRVDVRMSPAYVTAERIFDPYGGGGSKLAVSVTVPRSGVSSVVGVGAPPLVVDEPEGGRFCSLVCGIGVV